MADYVPKQGDVVWLSFDPQAGHEQAGRRPAFVISPAAYNGRTGLSLVCPITSKIKGYPFEVALPKGIPVSGVILSDQIKSLDWRARKAEFAASTADPTISEVLSRLRALIREEG